MFLWGKLWHMEKVAICLRTCIVNFPLGMNDNDPNLLLGKTGMEEKNDCITLAQVNDNSCHRNEILNKFKLA